MPRNLLLACCAALAAGAAPAENFDPGRFLEERCSRCHDAGVYQRENRRVRDLAQLEAQVRRCDANLGTGLFDEDIAAVVDYLNTRYYHFGR